MGRYWAKRTMLLLLIVMLNCRDRYRCSDNTLMQLQFKLPKSVSAARKKSSIAQRQLQFAPNCWIIRESTKLNCTSIYENMRWRQRTSNKKIS
ncbi:hypothetical protein CPB84DRAFT_1785721, partial [Gymnopilus junonius]